MSGEFLLIHPSLGAPIAVLAASQDHKPAASALEQQKDPPTRSVCLGGSLHPGKPSQSHLRTLTLPIISGDPSQVHEDTDSSLPSALGTWFIHHRDKVYRVRIVCGFLMNWGQGVIQIPEIPGRGGKPQTKRGRSEEEIGIRQGK